MKSELDRVRNTWERLGATDPYWAVLTEDTFHGDEAKARFFESGRSDVRTLLDVLDRHGRPYGDTVVDFGCGVGRLSYALAEHFRQVVGVDVAEPMLDEARAHNPYPDRVRFVHNAASTLPFEDESVDLVISVITLQHIAPSLTLRYLLEMARVVRPGGHLLIQVPSHIPSVRPIPRPHCRAHLDVLEAPAALSAGEASYVRVAITNMSDGVWPAGRLLNAGNHWLRDGRVVHLDDGRDSVRCPLGPGESTQGLIRISAPAEPGRYELEIDLVQESVAWWAQLDSPTTRVAVDVRPGAVAPDTGEAPQPETAGAMEMHGVRKELVCALFRQIGCTVLEAIPDDRAGTDWASYLYVVEVGEYSADLNHDG